MIMEISKIRESTREYAERKSLRPVADEPAWIADELATLFLHRRRGR